MIGAQTSETFEQASPPFEAPLERLCQAIPNAGPPLPIGATLRRAGVAPELAARLEPAQRLRLAALAP